MTRVAPARAEGHRAQQQQPPVRHSEADPVERVIFVERPTLIYITTGYLLAAFGAISLIVIGAYFGLSASISLLLALPLLFVPALRHLRRNTTRYTLTDARVEIVQGLLMHSTRNVPLRNVQNVTVSVNPLQRLLSFGDIVIDDAREGKAGVTLLRNIADPHRHAELLLRELYRWR